MANSNQTELMHIAHKHAVRTSLTAGLFLVCMTLAVWIEGVSFLELFFCCLAFVVTVFLALGEWRNHYLASKGRAVPE